MELCFEVINRSGIRRKLKKLYGEIAFEMSEYVSYEGGRSMSMTDIEEIDERDLQMTATISRASDSEPFEVTINIEDNTDNN